MIVLVHINIYYIIYKNSAFIAIDLNGSERTAYNWIGARCRYIWWSTLDRSHTDNPYWLISIYYVIVIGSTNRPSKTGTFRIWFLHKEWMSRLIRAKHKWYDCWDYCKPRQLHSRPNKCSYIDIFISIVYIIYHIVQFKMHPSDSPPERNHREDSAQRIPISRTIASVNCHKFQFIYSRLAV